jgi:hypothetical protein
MIFSQIKKSPVLGGNTGQEHYSKELSTLKE